jgi:RHS repeat-associated protein
MGKVTALMMDVITEKSGHTIVPNAVSVCITPCAPSPVPIPYPVVGSAVEGITDPPLRTKVEGQKFATTGSVIKTCHGNEPGTLKETCSLNTSGPCFIIMGAPIVISELGMMGITGALCISNKAVTVGASGSASGAGGAGGPGGGAGGGGAGGPGPSGPSGPSNGGGGGGGSNSGASASAASPGARGSGADAAAGSSSGPPGQHQCQNGHPVDMATGFVVDEATDLLIAGRIPFVFKRFYSSARNKDVRATLGPGWAHNWEMSVWEEANVTVLRDAEGRSIFFEQVAVGRKTFHRGERMELKKLADDRWEIFHLATRTTYLFDAFEPKGQAALRSVRDAFGNKIEVHYTGGRIQSIVDTASREIVFAWEGQRIKRLDVRVAATSEQTVEFAYTDMGCLASVTDALGSSELFEYDRQGRMISASLKTEVTFRYEYEPDTGRCKRTWGPKGLYDLVFSANLGERQTSCDGEEPRVYTIDDSGHVIREALPNGYVLVERAYDQDGFLIAQVNGAGEGSKYWYDARGNLARSVAADGGTTVFEYDENDLPRRKVAPDGLVTEYAYDPRGTLRRITLPDGRFFVATHDHLGRAVRLDGISGCVLVSEYDAQHNRIAETDAMGARTSYAFDALGRPVSRTDSLGGVTRRLLDRAGRVVGLHFADGSRISRTLDARGRVVREVDGFGNVTQMAYSGMGTLTRLVTPDNKAWAFKYNGKERLTEVAAPGGETYGCTYDELGRLVAEQTFDGRTLKYERDASGRVTKLTYPDGAWRAFSHDRCGRFVEETASDGSVVRIARDKQGRIRVASVEAEGETVTTTFDRDGIGRLIAEHHGDLVVRYAYDAEGRVAERILPNGSKTRFRFDRRGDAVAIEHNGASFDISRDVAGQERTITGPGEKFALHLGYDALGRLLEQRLGAEGTGSLGENVLRRLFAYDRAGRLASVTDARWGSSTFDYDAVGQLVGRRASGAKLEHSFDYDGAGSLIRALEEGARGDTWKLAPGGAVLSTPTAKYANDKRGRRIGVRDLRHTSGPERVTQYRWDVRDRLREVTLFDGTTIRYRYDAFGRRVAKMVFERGADMPSRSTRYVWTDARLVAEVGSDRKVRAFVHKPRTMVPLLHEEHGEVFLTVTDHLGTPKELIDAAGTVVWSALHTPWGRVERSWSEPTREQSGKGVSSPFRLLGQVYDEDADLCFTRFRVFDAATARWLTPDPLEINGGFRPVGFDGSPTVQIDPHGLSAEHEGEEPPLVDQARAARDARAAELGPERPPTRPAAVTGAFNPETGQVATGISGGGNCAEDDAARALGNPENVQFTEAVRPRPHDPPFNEVPVCPRCEERYGRDAFPPGTRFKSDETPAPAGGDAGGGGGG